ncbi:hypothetical protein [Devosia naphthalenivorans]|uniref:hypothetical protein n=1 Tax=Devosia naphthalenivorans TaxID=2082392 RepID=UPI000D349CE3|nr:hypothetical protein [Devosia naphthalenivorans]
MIKSVALAFATIALATAAAHADSKPENAGQQYELVDGSTYSNAGEMMQHLRDRQDEYAAGNPKEIVDAYPEEFENVGDLIQEKRVD